MTVSQTEFPATDAGLRVVSQESSLTAGPGARFLQTSLSAPEIAASSTCQ
jgi:hypothetical protein